MLLNDSELWQLSYYYILQKYISLFNQWLATNRKLLIIRNGGSMIILTTRTILKGYSVLSTSTSSHTRHGLEKSYAIYLHNGNHIQHLQVLSYQVYVLEHVEFSV